MCWAGSSCSRCLAIASTSRGRGRVPGRGGRAGGQGDQRADPAGERGHGGQGSVAQVPQATAERRGPLGAARTPSPWQIPATTGKEQAATWGGSLRGRDRGRPDRLGDRPADPLAGGILTVPVGDPGAPRRGAGGAPRSSRFTSTGWRDLPSARRRKTRPGIERTPPFQGDPGPPGVGATEDPPRLAPRSPILAIRRGSRKIPWRETSAMRSGSPRPWYPLGGGAENGRYGDSPSASRWLGG